MPTYRTKKVAVAADGTEHETMQQAQAHDIMGILVKRTGQSETANCLDVAEFIVDHTAEVLSILLTDGRSRRRIKKSAKKSKALHFESAYDKAETKKFCECMGIAPAEQPATEPTTP